jgi:hypothetical protein
VLLGLRTTPKEDNGVSVAELVYGAALALPVEFLSTAKLAAADFLKKLQQVELPATRSLSYAEAAAKPPAALLQASHVYVRRGGSLPPLSPLYVGPYEVLNRQVFPASSWRLRGDGQKRPPEAASGSRAFHGGPPGGTEPPPDLRSCGVTAAASSGSCDYGGTVAEDINIFCTSLRAVTPPNLLCRKYGK